MTVLVMGGTGRTGLQIVKQLIEAKMKVIVGSHSGRLNPELAQLNVDIRKFDLIRDTVEEIASKLDDVEVIIFAAGASQSHPELAEWIDLDGAVKLMDAAKQVKIGRYLMVSAAGAADRSTWDIYDIPSYYIAKYYAEKMLINSGLTYTVVRPPILSDGALTGKASLVKASDNDIISRADVAKMVVSSINNSHSFNKAFDIYGGNEPISQLLDQM